MRFAYLLLIGMAVFGMTGCGRKIPDNARLPLEKAVALELYSLDPTRLRVSDDEKDKDKKKETEEAEKFHGWRVLGKTTLKEAATRQKVVEALEKGVRESDGMVAMCFNPRHGIRVKYDDKTCDLVICFECLSAQIYIDDKREEGFLTTRSPQKVFDAVLKEAGVPLPKQAKD